MSAATYTYSARPDRASLRRQQQACVAEAASMGLVVAETFEDQAGDRSAMTRLRERAVAGLVTTIFVLRMDRLGRRVGAVSDFLAEMAAAGVQVRAVQGGALDASSIVVLLNNVTRDLGARVPHRPVDAR